MIEEIEPTPHQETKEGIVLPLDKLHKKYEKPFERNRGAKLKITISPPDIANTK